MSTTSSHASTYAESIEEQHFSVDDDMWQAKFKKALDNVAPSTQDLTTTNIATHRQLDSVSTDNSDSNPNSKSRPNIAFGLDPSSDKLDKDLKTPTIATKMLDDTPSTDVFPLSLSPNDTPSTVVADSIPAGPMEQLLHLVLHKVAIAERNRPTIMAEDYMRLQKRVEELEAEKKTWAERYQAYFAVRDQDLTNLLKVRELLAQERREHAAIRKLRDDDLANVLVLREKLAQATWSRPAPRHRSPSVSAPSVRQSRAEGADLWREAKAAAMEQRILELEASNEELRAANAELSSTRGKLESDTSASAGAAVLNRMEAMFEDSLKYREKMAVRLHQLRSEKEALQKEVAALEDRNLHLEGTVERLQRNLDR